MRSLSALTGNQRRARVAHRFTGGRTGELGARLKVRFLGKSFGFVGGQQLEAKGSSKRIATARFAHHPLLPLEIANDFLLCSLALLLPLLLVRSNSTEKLGAARRCTEYAKRCITKTLVPRTGQSPQQTNGQLEPILYQLNNSPLFYLISANQRPTTHLHVY